MNLPLYTVYHLWCQVLKVEACHKVVVLVFCLFLILPADLSCFLPLHNPFLAIYFPQVINGWVCANPRRGLKCTAYSPLIPAPFESMGVFPLTWKGVRSRPEPPSQEHFAPDDNVRCSFGNSYARSLPPPRSTLPFSVNCALKAKCHRTKQVSVLMFIQFLELKQGHSFRSHCS